MPCQVRARSPNPTARLLQREALDTNAAAKARQTEMTCIDGPRSLSKPKYAMVPATEATQPRERVNVRATARANQHRVDWRDSRKAMARAPDEWNIDHDE
jgi:hypothetical protein